MAIGWLTVLKLVPWDDVIRNAPKVADGAKKLWSTLAKKPSGATSPGTPAQLSPNPPSLSQLQTQLDTAVAEIAELHQQMLASSELIQALADQNAQLIKRVEVNRLRVLWLASAVSVVTVFSLVFLFAR